jgi:hypothetical protein
LVFAQALLCLKLDLSIPTRHDMVNRSGIHPWLPSHPCSSFLHEVRAMIETYPLAKAAEAYARMMSGNAEFRVALTL